MYLRGHVYLLWTPHNLASLRAPRAQIPTVALLSDALQSLHSFYRTISGVCLCWDLAEAKGPKGLLPGFSRFTLGRSALPQVPTPHHPQLSRAFLPPRFL